MKRDVIIIPFSSEELVIASDNSGAIGQKASDIVNVPDSTVGYYSFRVAAMECMAAWGEPFAVIVHNFTGGSSWDFYVKGIRQAAAELELPHLPITGSTESNFPMLQSAMGLIVLGKREEGGRRVPETVYERVFAVIGKPLFGGEVIEDAEAVAPLALFKAVLEMEGVQAVLPVGSKGILHELRVMTGREDLLAGDIECELDILKSGGPSTCFLAALDKEVQQDVERMAGELYHSLSLK